MPKLATHHSKRAHHKFPLISIQMASKTYAEDPLDYKTLVLRNIYLDVYEGEFVTVFGPSGSGKSTLLNLIAGLERPTGGRVMVRRRDLSKYDSDELAQFHRRKMGFVFQNFNLIKSLNVWENVALPQTASGVNYAERKRKAMNLLKLFRLDQYANRHPNELSGGEQQRVAIARALVNDPIFLLVDEPTGNLDSKSAQSVMEILQDIHIKEKHTIILVTHNPNQLKYATRVIYMEDGQIVIEENRDEKGELATPARILESDTTEDEPRHPQATTPVSATTAADNEPLETDVIHTKITSTKPKPPKAPVKAKLATPTQPIEPVTTVNEPLTPAAETPATKKTPKTTAAPDSPSSSKALKVPTESPPENPSAPIPPSQLVNDEVVKTVIIKGEGDK